VIIPNQYNIIFYTTVLVGATHLVGTKMRKSDKLGIVTYNNQNMIELDLIEDIWNPCTQHYLSRMEPVYKRGKFQP
jgi:hypothetical protein